MASRLASMKGSEDSGGSRIPRPTKSATKKTVKINKARPLPDFDKIHAKWQHKLEKGISESKRPTTNPNQFDFIHSDLKRKHSSESDATEVVRRASCRNIPPSRQDKEVSVPRRASVFSRGVKSVAKPVSVPSHKPATEVEFKADPKSLAKIMDSVDSSESSIDHKMSRKRSIYDKKPSVVTNPVDRLSKYYSSLYSTGTDRRPLGTLENMAEIENRTPERLTRTPRSIYHSATKSAVLGSATKGSTIKAAVETIFKEGSSKAKRAASKTKKTVTWSNALKSCVNQPDINEEKPSVSSNVVQRLNFDSVSQEDCPPSLLQELQLAERMVDAELGASKPDESRPREPVLHSDTYTVAEESMIVEPAAASSSPYYRVPTSKPSPALSKSAADTPSLPDITGVVCIGDTPPNPRPDSNDSSITSLLGNMNIKTPCKPACVEYESSDSSPVLPAKCKVVSTNQLKVDLPTPVKPGDLTNTDQKINGKPVDKHIDLDSPGNISSLPIIDCSLHDQLHSTALLTDTLDQIDCRLKVFRRRSNALQLQAEPGNELQQQLERILAEEKKLKQQKRELQQRLNGINQNEEPSEKNSIKAFCRVSETSKEGGATVSELISPEDTVVAGSATLQATNTNDVSDLPELENTIQHCVQVDKAPLPLRAASTGALQSAPNSSPKKKRESINLMVFSPTQHTILSRSIQTVILESTNEATLVGTCNTAQSDAMDCDTHMKSVDHTSEPLEVNPAPIFTIVSEPQGCHLLVTPPRQQASISPLSLRSQSQLINAIDSVGLGRTSDHNSQILAGLQPLPNDSTSLPANISAFTKTINGQTTCWTPVAQIRGGTISIASPCGLPCTSHADRSPIPTGNPTASVNHPASKVVCTDNSVNVSASNQPEVNSSTSGMDQSTAARSVASTFSLLNSPETKSHLSELMDSFRHNEVAIYMCRSVTMPTSCPPRPSDPVAVCLLSGDNWVNQPSHFLHPKLYRALSKSSVPGSQ